MPDTAGAPTLVCIGNITVDQSVQPDGTATEALGGDAVFATLAARRTGCAAEMLAPIGADLPSDLADQLVAAGLSLDQPRRSLPTVRNVIHYAADGGRTWDLQCSEQDFDTMSVHPSDVGARVLAARGLLVLAMSLASQLVLLPWLRANSAATVYLDLQEDYVAGNEDALLGMVAASDVFLPSEIEAMRLTGCDDPAAAARYLLGHGPSVVVVKLAERGCLVAVREQDQCSISHLPAEPVVPVDPTGAGDAFCGAFAAAHLDAAAVSDAARTGMLAARRAIGAPGVRALLDDAITTTVRGQRAG